PIATRRPWSRTIRVSRGPILPGEDGTDRGDLLLLHRVLLAFGAEFLALLAVQALGIRFLGAFERFGGTRLAALRRSRVRAGGRGSGGLSENGTGKQQQRCAEDGG